MNITLLSIDFILFFIAICLCFYVPGRVLLAFCKVKLYSLELYFFSLATGFVLFTFISYIFDSINLFALIYIFLIACVFIVITKKIPLLTKVEKIDKTSIYIIVFLSVIFCYPMFFSGYHADGIHLLGSNYFDAALHLSLINELQVHFPPQNPGFAGTYLHDYHFFSDYSLAKIIQIFHIDPVIAYFQCFPFFIAILWSGGVYIFVKRWSNNISAARWSIFLTQFGGSAVFLVYILGYTKVSLNSGFGMLQPSVSLVNPPFASSVVIVIFGLFSLYSYLQAKQKGWIVPIILFFGMAAEFKVYAGIILFSGFLFLIIIKIFQRQFSFIGIFLGILAVFSATYLRIIGKGGFLIFYPYWEPISVAKDNLKFMNYDDQMTTYYRLHMWHRIIWLYIKIFCMFLFGNIGSRIFGIIFLYFYPHKKRFFLSEFTLTLLSMLIVSFCIPLFFIQSIKVFEITQMFNYFLFFISLFASLGLGAFFSRKLPGYIKLSITIIIIALTLPSNYEVYYNYLPTAHPDITMKTLEVMKKLQKLGTYDDTVLVLPTVQNPDLSSSKWVYDTNMNVSAFANKRTYLNYQNLTLPEDIKQRESLVLSVIEGENGLVQRSTVVGLLHTNHIKFIYSTYPLPVIAQLHLKELYKNKEAYLYTVL